MSQSLSHHIKQLQIPSGDKVYIKPDIPLKKIKNAIKSYGDKNIQPDEIILLLDDTLLGSAKTGLLITEDALYIKGSFCEPIAVNLKDIASISHKARKLFINGKEAIDCAMPSKSTCEILYNFLEAFINNPAALSAAASTTANPVASSPAPATGGNDLRQLQTEAEQGSLEAQFNLGQYYFDNRETRGNLDKAFYWFEKAAEKSDPEVQYQIGLAYDLVDNEDKAFLWYEKAAERGHKDAQLDVGLAFMLGKGVEPDEYEGYKWFKAAVENGNIDALWSLGMSYLNGEGVEQDYDKAFGCFRQGAEKGEPFAQNSLGVCYLKGRGTEKDEKKAFYWVKKAAESGHAIAQGNLGDYYRKGTGTAIDMNKAYLWYQRAAEQGDKYAIKALNRHFSDDGSASPAIHVQRNAHPRADQQISESSSACLSESSTEECDSRHPVSTPQKVKIRTNSKFSNSLFKPFAQLNGSAVVIVALLRNNAADKILTLLSKIPGINIIGIMGKLLLNKPLAWLNEQFVDYGEQFIMDKLVDYWQAHNIEYDTLLKQINTIPSFLIEEKIISDSKALLEKYYN